MFGLGGIMGIMASAYGSDGGTIGYKDGKLSLGGSIGGAAGNGSGGVHYIDDALVGHLYLPGTSDAHAPSDFFLV